MKMRELRNELSGATTNTEMNPDITPIIVNDTYCNWATCFVENVIMNTFGEMFSSTIVEMNKEHCLFHTETLEFKIAITNSCTDVNNYMSLNNECICWEFGVIHNNEFDKLSSGYTVVNTCKCEIVDCIMN